MLIIGDGLLTFTVKLILYSSISRYGGSEVEHVEVSEKDLAEKARAINIQNLQPFFNSAIFKVNALSY